MNEVTFVILAYSRPLRLQMVINSIHNFLDNPRILVYVDKAGVGAPSREISAQADVFAVCKEFKNNGLIKDYRFSESNQGTKRSYFNCFGWGFQNSENVVLLEDDMIFIQDPSAFIDTSIKVFGSDKNVGMAVLFANFNHPSPENRFQITNWPIMWGVFLNKKNYSHICDYLSKVGVDEIEEVVSLFAKRELKGSLQSIFRKRFEHTWRFKYSRALESRTAWDTQWQFALWGTQLRTLVPGHSLIGDLGVDEYSVSTARKRMKPLNCRSVVRKSVGSKYYCSACESFREVQNFSLPVILRNNWLVNFLLQRGLL
jgi:hypothetical protein